MNSPAKEYNNRMMQPSCDDNTVHAFIRNAIELSGSVPCQREVDEKFIDQESPVRNISDNNKHKECRRKVKRSLSAGAIDRRTGISSSEESLSSSSSLESLIKQNLCTAQALHPVLVSNAKERNYLHGRSGTDSLLGRAELKRIFPKNEVTIFICTWNMNGEEPPANLNELFLSEQMEHLADVYVIGTQESYSETSEWEIGIQETIGPTHVLFHSETLGTIFLGVFIRRELIWYCSVPEDDSHSVRPGSAFKTKGGVGICFYLFGSSFLFISAHLTAHDHKLKDRISDVERIMKSLELPKELPVIKRMMRNRIPNVVSNFDYVFWFGDLNFRLTQPRELVLNWISKQVFPLDPNLPFPLYDQLMSSMKKGLVFRGFQEGAITFPPTYKFDVGTQKYDSSHKKRTPSYTDRILFKCRKTTRSILAPVTNYTSVKCLAYTSVPSICTSDHKPVWGLFTCKLRPGIDTIPLAAGYFNRDVYIDALKRRAVRHKRKFSFNDSRSCVIH